MTAHLIRRTGTSLVILAGISVFVFILLRSLPLAVKRNSLGDQVVPAVAFTAYAMPDFLLYLIALLMLAGYFRYRRSPAMGILV